jgi:hypothetical protein
MKCRFGWRLCWSWWPLPTRRQRPQTLTRWHRELGRRKWTYRRSALPGRPRIAAERGYSSSFASRRTTGAGATAASRESYANSGWTSRRRDPLAAALTRSEARAAKAGALLERVPGRPGHRHPGLRLLHRSRPSGSKRSTYCSSSSCPQGGCTWRASAPGIAVCSSGLPNGRRQ